MPRTGWGQSWREYHALDDPCYHQTWCRLHWWPGFDAMGASCPQAYPFAVKRPIGGQWQNIDVHCGPGAFLPKRAAK